MQKLRFGVIGLGNMGSVHASSQIPALREGELTAVCDIVPSKMDRYEGVQKFASSSELIGSGVVDAVLIATPHYDHTPIGIEAFQNGLHVLVEKPISAHKADAERLIGAKKSSTVFGAMFQTRTSGAFQTIKQMIDSGELGEIRRMNWIVTNWFRSAAYYASGGWRATWAGEGGGVLLNQCPHNLDLIQWLFGVPSKVRAFCGYGKYHDIEVEDAVTAYLEFPNGSTGVFVTTTGEAPGTDRLEIAGDRGKLVFEKGKITFDRTVEPVQEFSDTTSDMFPSLRTWNCEISYPSSPASHQKIIENFVNAVLHGDKLIAPGEEGLNSIELANSMLLSSWTQSEVNLPIDSAKYEQMLQDKIRGSSHSKKVEERTAADMAASFH